MNLNEYLEYLQELLPGGKCRKATQTYRVRLAQLQRLTIDAESACEKLRDNPLASKEGYSNCMKSLKLRKTVARGRAKNERLRIQKYCKKSVAAQLAGTKHAPEVSPESEEDY